MKIVTDKNQNADYKDRARRVVIGIEGGATRTVAIYDDFEKTEQAEFPAGNIRLLNEQELERLFESIYARFGNAEAVVAGMAGARDKKDFQRIESALKKFWKDSICAGTNDLETALNAGETGEKTHRILVIAGTGACVYGKSKDGATVKLNGWGHILGDRGSGYHIGLTALRKTVEYFDIKGKFPALGSRLLRKLMLNEPDELIEWVKKATKSEIASLAVEVFESAKSGDKLAKEILAEALEALVKNAIACARRLLKNKKETPTFLLSGGVFKNQASFVRNFATKIKLRYPQAKIVVLKENGAVGAVRIAKQLLSSGGFELTKIENNYPRHKNNDELWRKALPVSTRLPMTEQPHPLSPQLDKMPIKKAIDIFLDEDSKIADAIRPARNKIGRAVNMIASGFKANGRLIYVGAGTSGRLGVLDASECPPTFGVSPEQVQAVIAGGSRALRESVEGAEDDYEAGARAIDFRNVGKNDVVFGIAASGKTPFVWGALNAAKARGAKTILLCFNPYLKIPECSKPSLLITVQTGAEILTGSTRLKAGTATKMILNIISTLAMARSGRVKGNLMTNMRPTNKKLKERAIRIVSGATEITSDRAKKILEKAGWDIQKAIQIAKLDQ